mgnify:FL=1
MVPKADLDRELARLIEESKAKYPGWFKTPFGSLSGTKQVTLVNAQTKAYSQFKDDPNLLNFAQKTNFNLIALGQSSIDASQAVNAIADAQRLQNAQLAALTQYVGANTGPATKQPIDLTNAGNPGVKEKLSETINSVTGAIGTTGAVILAGIIIFALVKK